MRRTISGIVPIDESAEQDNFAVLDHWLEESGRRKHSAEWLVSLYAHPENARAVRAPLGKHRIAQPILLYLFATAALVYALHYFLEVELAIASLRGVIVFVALK